MKTDVMITETHHIKVNGLLVNIVRKEIKNLHLGVYPPDGRVRVAAPLAVSDEAVRLAVVDKLGWIKRRQARFQAQPRQGKREMINGESHYFLGQRYRLRLIEHSGAAKVAVRNTATIELYARSTSSTRYRERVLQDWYRQQLIELIPPLIEKWQGILGVECAGWRIRRMKTRWGTCSTETGRISLNLELAKKPIQCLEYIIAHELVHLIERRHNDLFVSLMSEYLPQWRLHRQLLNDTPLAHEIWM
jgi:predicted metal-dependent hydrolase